MSPPLLFFPLLLQDIVASAQYFWPYLTQRFRLVCLFLRMAYQTFQRYVSDMIARTLTSAEDVGRRCGKEIYPITPNHQNYWMDLSAISSLSEISPVTKMHQTRVGKGSSSDTPTSYLHATEFNVHQGSSGWKGMRLKNSTTANINALRQDDAFDDDLHGEDAIASDYFDENDDSSNVITTFDLHPPITCAERLSVEGGALPSILVLGQYSDHQDSIGNATGLIGGGGNMQIKDEDRMVAVLENDRISPEQKGYGPGYLDCPTIAGTSCNPAVLAYPKYLNHKSLCLQSTSEESTRSRSSKPFLGHLDHRYPAKCDLLFPETMYPCDNSQEGEAAIQCSRNGCSSSILVAKKNKTMMPPSSLVDGLQGKNIHALGQGRTNTPTNSSCRSSFKNDLTRRSTSSSLTLTQQEEKDRTPDDDMLTNVSMYPSSEDTIYSNILDKKGATKDSSLLVNCEIKDRASLLNSSKDKYEDGDAEHFMLFENIEHDSKSTSWYRKDNYYGAALNPGHLQKVMGVGESNYHMASMIQPSVASVKKAITEQEEDELLVTPDVLCQQQLEQEGFTSTKGISTNGSSNTIDMVIEIPRSNYPIPPNLKDQGKLAIERIPFLEKANILHGSHSQFYCDSNFDRKPHYFLRPCYRAFAERIFQDHNPTIDVTQFISSVSVLPTKDNLFCVINEGTIEHEKYVRKFADSIDWYHLIERLLAAKSDSLSPGGGDMRRGNTAYSIGYTGQNFKRQDKDLTGRPQVVRKTTCEDISLMASLTELTDSIFLASQLPVPFNDIIRNSIGAFKMNLDYGEMGNSTLNRLEGMTIAITRAGEPSLQCHVDSGNAREESYNLVVCYNKTVLWREHSYRVALIGYGKKCISDFMHREVKTANKFQTLHLNLSRYLNVSRDRLEVGYHCWPRANEDEVVFRRPTFDKVAFYSVYVSYILKAKDQLQLTFLEGIELMLPIVCTNIPLHYCHALEKSMVERQQQLQTSGRRGSTNDRNWAISILNHFANVETFMSGTTKSKSAVGSRKGSRFQPTFNQSAITYDDVRSMLISLKFAIDVANREKSDYPDVLRAMQKIHGVGPLQGQHMIAICAMVGLIHNTRLIRQARICGNNKTTERLKKLRFAKEDHAQLVAGIGKTFNFPELITENLICEFFREFPNGTFDETKYLQIRPKYTDTFVKDQRLFCLNRYIESNHGLEPPLPILKVIKTCEFSSKMVPYHPELWRNLHAFDDDKMAEGESPWENLKSNNTSILLKRQQGCQKGIRGFMESNGAVDATDNNPKARAIHINLNDQTCPVPRGTQNKGKINHSNCNSLSPRKRKRAANDEMLTMSGNPQQKDAAFQKEGSKGPPLTMLARVAEEKEEDDCGPPISENDLGVESNCALVYATKKSMIIPDKNPKARAIHTNLNDQTNPVRQGQTSPQYKGSNDITDLSECDSLYPRKRKCGSPVLESDLGIAGSENSVLPIIQTTISVEGCFERVTFCFYTTAMLALSMQHGIKTQDMNIPRRKRSLSTIQVVDNKGKLWFRSYLRQSAYQYKKGKFWPVNPSDTHFARDYEFPFGKQCDLTRKKYTATGSSKRYLSEHMFPSSRIAQTALLYRILFILCRDRTRWIEDLSNGYDYLNLVDRNNPQETLIKIIRLEKSKWKAILPEMYLGVKRSLYHDGQDIKHTFNIIGSELQTIVDKKEKAT